MQAIDNLKVFLEDKPSWSGTIDVKSGNEKNYKRIGELAEYIDFN